MKLPKIKLKIENLKLRRILPVVLTLAVVGFIVSSAVAQEIQRSFTVINPSIQETIDPGKTAQGTTAVINDTNNPLTFNLTVQDYIVSDSHGTPNLLPPGTLNDKYSAAAWIGVTPSTFTLRPGQRQNLDYFIQVPPNASPCGHYAAIVYTPSIKSTTGQVGAAVQAQIGALFYLTVTGTCKESAEVTKFTAPSFQEYGSVNILTEIKNNSDIHIKPTGTITLSGLFANSSYKLPENNIFPQTVRDYQNTVGQNFMLGQYKAVLLGSYGASNNLPLTATLYFWVFPWRLALVIALAIIAVILAVLYFRKKKKSGPKTPEEAKDEAKTEAQPSEEKSDK